MAGNQASSKRALEADGTADGNSSKRPCYDYDDLLTILVGPNEKRFTLHKVAICTKSKFFEAACSERWREGQEKVIRLPEICPCVFQLYADWIYTNDLSTAKSTKRPVDTLVKLHLLGDILDDIGLRNKSMQDLSVTSNDLHKAPSIGAFNLAYQQTTSSSLLRKWIVDSMIFRHSREDFAKKIGEYPSELVQQVALKLMQQKEIIEGEAFLTKASDYLEKTNA